jgi:imidazoleglycerol-phosphate dehydratase
MRIAEIQRNTNETEVYIKLNLDGSGNADLQTGIPFLDHMLHHIAVHGLFDMTVKAKGDLGVDPHHTVEDVAIVLGQAFEKALGERRGIFRMSSTYVPMDESLAFVAIDLSGRPYAVLDMTWHTPSVGSIPTSLFSHFIESFAFACRCNLHVRVLYGRDDHHQVEAIFKALGRVLEQAVRIDPRRVKVIPSTKGSL